MDKRYCCIFFVIFSFFLLFSCSGKVGDGKDLLEAVDLGNLEKTVKLLKGGVDPNTVDSEGKPVLVRALKQEREAIALALLKYGASPNTGVDGRDAPLCLAMGGGFKDIKRALVESGADLNIPCEELVVSPAGSIVFTMGIKKTLPFLKALTECDVEVVSAMLKRMDNKSRQALAAKDLLTASLKLYLKDSQCNKVSDLVFGPGNSIGFCDEDIDFIDDELREGDTYAYLDLEFDGTDEKIVSEFGTCGSCGCSFVFYKKNAGAWEEIENIDCSAGDFRGSSRPFNGHKVLCTGNVPLYYWDLTKEPHIVDIQ